MPIWKPELKAVSCVKKVEKPILTKADIPYEAELVFNAGVAKVDGKYVMVFRDDHGATREEFAAGTKYITKTAVGIAVSDNGIDGWRVAEKPILHYDFADKENVINLLGGEHFCPDIRSIYDPRITVLEDKLYLCLAMDTAHGIRGCIAELSRDLKTVKILSASIPDNRNMVLFPEKIGGHYMRLERPFTVYSRGDKDRFDIWISSSPDLEFWGRSKLVMGVEHVPFANDKIGPAAPPVKTPYGWLTTFHAVDKATEGRGQDEWDRRWNKRYTAGIMLLDLEDPSHVKGMCKTPLLVPELPHEAEQGYRQNVIFPGGMILEENGEVKIYYGAADTVECVATARVEDLVALCSEPL